MKGTARADSDVDLILVVEDDEYARRSAENRVAAILRDCCDYEGGYVEATYVSRSFVREAAERGSEPTRNSFVDASLVYCIDPDIETWLSLIPVYPDQEKQKKIESFYAQFHLNRTYFWKKGQEANDRYLQHRAATDIVLYGCRLILAYNGILFPCHRELVEQTLTAPAKPADLRGRIERLLKAMTDAAKEEFCRGIDELSDWSGFDTVSRFVLDTEMSWYTGSPAVSDW